MTTDPAVDAAFNVAAAAQLACLLEAAAPKPGNVSPGRSFADSSYEDYLASAAAIGGPLAGVGVRPLGRTIRLAVESTAQWTRSNTNLGLVLLLAPLARAALEKGVGSLFRGESEEKEGVGTHLRGKGDGSLFRGAVHHVLDATTVEDARDVYAAIRMAAPGGLGRVDEQDIAQEPDRTLLEVMRLAADRDGVAREYATAFETTFDVGAPALDRARTAGLSWNDAIVETFLTLLAAGPDTHIARRAGPARAADVTRRARGVLAAGGVRSKDGRRAIDDMDRALRDPRHAANPGTTADLTAAAIFVVLIGGAGGRHGAR
jgi:triphosphoribosyl-dephospho-CoA synthase